MLRRWIGRLSLVGAIGGAAWFVVRFLRGTAAPAFESGGNTRVPATPAPLVPTADPAEPVVSRRAEPEPEQVEAEAPADDDGTDPKPEPLRVEAIETVTGQQTDPSSSAWVEAQGSEPGPATHPVKAKLKSGIYHLPGMLNYDRTVADRWYTDAEAAEADGLRKAKR